MWALVPRACSSRSEKGKHASTKTERPLVINVKAATAMDTASRSPRHATLSPNFVAQMLQPTSQVTRVASMARRTKYVLKTRTTQSILFSGTGLARRSARPIAWARTRSGAARAERPVSASFSRTDIRVTAALTRIPRPHNAGLSAPRRNVSRKLDHTSFMMNIFWYRT